MRHTRTFALWFAGALALLLAAPAGAQSPKLEHQEHELEQPPLAPNNFDNGFITLDQGLWEALSDKPQDEFENAMDAFASGKNHEMAGSIYSAAAVTRLAAGRALPEPRQRLVASLFELKDLAEKAEQGKITAKEQMEGPFGRTLAALSQYYAARAEFDWNRDKAGDTGKALAQGVKDLEHAFLWEGYHPSADESTTVETARTTATRLTTTKDYDRNQVNDALAAFTGLVRDYTDGIWKGVPDLTPPEAKGSKAKGDQS